MAWGKVTLLWKHVLANLVASSVDSDYPVLNILSRREDIWYLAASTTTPIHIYPGSGPGGGDALVADYFFISGHNLFTIGATVTLQWSTNGFDITGVDKVILGDMSITAGWSPTVATLASIGGGESGNCLEITNSGAASGSANQLVSGLTIGKYYKMTAYFKKATGVSGGIKIGTSVDDDAYFTLTGLTDAGWTAYDFTFKAITEEARITLVNESTISAETALFDTVSLYQIDSTDAASYIPPDDKTFAKRFNSLTKNYWRLAIEGTLSEVPQIAIGYWGERAEISRCTSSFDPNKRRTEGNINKSQGGIITGIHEKYRERGPITYDFGEIDADGQEYSDLNERDINLGRELFGLMWEPDEHPTETYLMHDEKGEFNMPLTRGGGQRRARLTLTGRMEE